MEPEFTTSTQAEGQQTDEGKKARYIKYGSIAFIGIIILVVAGWFAYEKLSLRSALADAQAAYDTNNLDGAISQLDTLLLKRPGDARVLSAKALALAQKGSLAFKEKEFGEQAAALAMQAIEKDPKSGEAYYALAYANEIQQKYDEAHTNYARALELNPKNAAALFGDGHAYDLQGETAKAEDRYRRAMEVSPSYDQPYFGLSRILALKGDMSGSKEMIKKGFETTRNLNRKAEAAYTMAYIYLGEKDLNSARYYAEQAVSLDPNYPLGWYIRGAVLFNQFYAADLKAIGPVTALEIINASTASLNKALALNPNQSIAYLQLATIQVFMKDYVAAERTFRRGLAAIENDITLDKNSKERIRAQYAEEIEKARAFAKQYPVKLTAKK